MRLDRRDHRTRLAFGLLAWVLYEDGKMRFSLRKNSSLSCKLPPTESSRPLVVLRKRQRGNLVTPKSNSVEADEEKGDDAADGF